MEGMQKLEEKVLRLKHENDQIITENLKLHEKCLILEEENHKMKSELEKAISELKGSQSSRLFPKLEAPNML